ncbi:tyrosine-type recombinase/integrase [Vibrio fluminensis]|uniref:tyrosine-type recombinase/integrase n=1 Tax=Vibrio fluminensis TaxID=2783614 RepID=UPI001886B1CD|nr:tyrosine-type recombinase/integrase [Vibrio fluminensis]
MKKNVRVITDSKKAKSFIELLSSQISVDVANELTDFLYSDSSLLALTNDWNLFVDFCQSKNVEPIPASTTAVRLFIEKSSAIRKLSSLKRYVITISLFHKTLGLPDPTKNSRVKSALACLRIDKKGDHQSTNALTRFHLTQLHQQLIRSQEIKDWRDLAIYHVMFEGVMRRSELRDLELAQIEVNHDYISIYLDHEEVTLTKDASLALYRWLNVRGSQGRFVFTAIDRHGNLSFEQLNDSSIYRTTRRASELLGVKIKFSGQSLRVGAVQELAQQGVNIRDIQRAGRWLSPAMPYQYVGNKAKAELERMRYLSFSYIE